MTDAIYFFTPPAADKRILGKQPSTPSFLEPEPSRPSSCAAGHGLQDEWLNYSLTGQSRIDVPDQSDSSPQVRTYLEERALNWAPLRDLVSRSRQIRSSAVRNPGAVVRLNPGGRWRVRVILRGRGESLWLQPAVARRKWTQ